MHLTKFAPGTKVTIRRPAGTTSPTAGTLTGDKFTRGQAVYLWVRRVDGGLEAVALTSLSAAV